VQPVLRTIDLLGIYGEPNNNQISNRENTVERGPIPMDRLSSSISELAQRNACIIESIEQNTQIKYVPM
jgi:hypothetical protein